MKETRKNKRLRSRHLFFLRLLARKPASEAGEGARQRGFWSINERNKEKQASAEQTFVFPAPVSEKTRQRSRRRSATARVLEHK